MPYMYVVLKSGTQLPIADAESADWVKEPEYTGAPGEKDVLRLVFRRGEKVLAKFNGDDVSGFIWHDGAHR